MRLKTNNQSNRDNYNAKKAATTCINEWIYQKNSGANLCTYQEECGRGWGGKGAGEAGIWRHQSNIDEIEID